MRITHISWPSVKRYFSIQLLSNCLKRGFYERPLTRLDKVIIEHCLRKSTNWSVSLGRHLSITALSSVGNLIYSSIRISSDDKRKGLVLCQCTHDWDFQSAEKYFKDELPIVKIFSFKFFFSLKNNNHK